MPFTLRVTDLRDRELLAMVDEQKDTEGFATTNEVAKALWPGVMNNGDAKGQREATAAVSRRLAWMVRYGVVFRAPLPPDQKTVKHTRWGLTDEGRALLAGQLNAITETTIERLDGMQPVYAIDRITQRAQDDLVKTLMRRAWQYGTGSRR